MFRKIAISSLSLAIGAAALTVASLSTVSSASAFDGRYERGYERPYGWRPAPPPMPGYWGQRHWRRHHDGYGFRPPPAYGYGWR